jgi:hypothetical protein
MDKIKIDDLILLFATTTLFYAIIVYTCEYYEEKDDLYEGAVADIAQDFIGEIDDCEGIVDCTGAYVKWFFNAIATVTGYIIMLALFIVCSVVIYKISSLAAADVKKNKSLVNEGRAGNVQNPVAQGEGPAQDQGPAQGEGVAQQSPQQGVETQTKFWYDNKTGVCTNKVPSIEQRAELTRTKREQFLRKNSCEKAEAKRVINTEAEAKKAKAEAEAKKADAEANRVINTETEAKQADAKAKAGKQGEANAGVKTEKKDSGWTTIRNNVKNNKGAGRGGGSLAGGQVLLNFYDAFYN